MINSLIWLITHSRQLINLTCLISSVEQPIPNSHCLSLGSPAERPRHELLSQLPDRPKPTVELAEIETRINEGFSTSAAHMFEGGLCFSRVHPEREQNAGSWAHMLIQLRTLWDRSDPLGEFFEFCPNGSIGHFKTWSFSVVKLSGMTSVLWDHIKLRQLPSNMCPINLRSIEFGTSAIMNYHLHSI